MPFSPAKKALLKAKLTELDGNLDSLNTVLGRAEQTKRASARSCFSVSKKARVPDIASMRPTRFHPHLRAEAVNIDNWVEGIENSSVTPQDLSTYFANLDNEILKVFQYIDGKVNDTDYNQAGSYRVAIGQNVRDIKAILAERDLSPEEGDRAAAGASQERARPEVDLSSQREEQATMQICNTLRIEMARLAEENLRLRNGANEMSRRLTELEQNVSALRAADRDARPSQATVVSNPYALVMLSSPSQRGPGFSPVGSLMPGQRPLLAIADQLQPQ